MHTFSGGHLAEFYPHAVNKVQTFGSLVTPRFKPCHELRPVAFTTYRWTCTALPGVNYRFAYAEFMAILCGWDDVEWLQRFNKNISQFSDDGVTFYGAYGPRVFYQLQGAITHLCQDPDSRQGMAAIWEARDLTKATKDVPCNTHFYLKIRDGQLHMTLSRRSADIIWGVPYDNYVFGLLLTHLADCLQVQTGSLVEVIDSLHVYTPDAGYYTAARIEQAKGPARPLNTPLFTCTSLRTLREIYSQARRAVVSGTRTTGIAEQVRRFLCA